MFDAARTARVRSIRDFDEYVMTPYCGFAGADDYYARSGSARVLDEIAVPTLVLHACDDPFVRLTASTRAKLQSNPNITFIEPAHGGHCAFLENASEGYDGYWGRADIAAICEGSRGRKNACAGASLLSEWSAECGAEDPVLVVPWSSPDGAAPLGRSARRSRCARRHRRSRRTSCAARLATRP